MTERSTVDNPRCNEAAVREVVRHIELMPHRWYQRSWALTRDRRATMQWMLSVSFKAILEAYETGGGQCGTTFCVAGWAARLAGYVDEDGKPTQKIRDWVTQAEIWGYDSGEEVPAEIWINSPSGEIVGDRLWRRLGAEILGISEEDAEIIFDADFATTVPQLKIKLTGLLGIEFEEGADPRAI